MTTSVRACFRNNTYDWAALRIVRCCQNHVDLGIRRCKLGRTVFVKALLQQRDQSDLDA
jgi:hypothetical protein